MRKLDMAVLAINSNSYNESHDSGSTPAPLRMVLEVGTVPNIKFVVTKGDETHEFLSYGVNPLTNEPGLEAWIMNECDSELYEAYRWADADERRGCDGFKEWVSYCLTADQLTEYAEDKGWKVERVKE